MPVFEVLLQDERAHVGVEVEDARPVDVQDGVEAVPVPVEEVFRNVLTMNEIKTVKSCSFPFPFPFPANFKGLLSLSLKAQVNVVVM